MLVRFWWLRLLVTSIRDRLFICCFKERSFVLFVALHILDHETIIYVCVSFSLFFYYKNVQTPRD